MERLLLKNDKEQYLKEINTANQKVIFTNNKNEAKTYSGEWFAETELEFINFHFKEQEDVKTLHMIYENVDNNFNPL